MEVTSVLKALAQQQNAGTSQDGATAGLRMSRMGQLFVVDWKTELVLAGAAYNVTVGGVTGGAAELPVVGGGNGTVIDTDEPEMAIGTPTGYYHIPLGFTAAVQQDMDADIETSSILLFADLAAIIPLPIAASSTVETPQNLLDGGPASVSLAQSAVTTAITDPTCSMILAWATCQAAQVAADGTIIATNRCDYDPNYPVIFKGPCSVVACWGGTSAASGMCSYNWAEVPIGRYE